MNILRLGLKLAWVLILTAALSAGCAGPPEPSGQPEQPAPDLSEADKPSEPVFVDDPDSPYPMVTESWSVDMDGDGVEELVELRAEKTWVGNEFQPDKWFESNYGTNPYTLLVTRGGTVYELPLGREDNEGPVLYPWYYEAGAFWTADRAGSPVLVMWGNTLSCGGAGNIDVYAVALQSGEPVFLPVPVFGIRSELDEEAMIAQVTVPQTGYSETLELNQWLEEDREILYHEDGSLCWPVPPRNIDGFCNAGSAEEGVLLNQYMWGAGHIDGMGFLATTLSWQDGQAIVLDQHFDWHW